MNPEIGFCYGKSRLFPSRLPHVHISSFMSTAVFYCGPVVQLTVSEAERQGSLVRILRSQLSFLCPEGTSGGILKSPRPSVSQSVRPLQFVSQQ